MTRTSFALAALLAIGLSAGAAQAQQHHGHGSPAASTSSDSAATKAYREANTKMHKNMDLAAGGIVNPAGLTQHGVSLHDAIKAMPFPMVEVHMSNIAAREEWRHHSIIASAVNGTVQGLGWRSYAMGLRAVVEIAREAKKS